MVPPPTQPSRAGLRTLLVEPEHDACRAAVRLFDVPVAQAQRDRPDIPGRRPCLRSRAARRPCTLPGRAAQLAMLRELRRIVRHGGRIGLLVYLAARLPLDDPPEGNHFPADGDLEALIREAGLDVLDMADAHRMSGPPAGWQIAPRRFRRELHRRFGRTPQLRTSDEQSERIGQLLESGQLVPRVLVLRGV